MALAQIITALINTNQRAVLAQSITVIVDGNNGPNWAMLGVGLAEIAVGFAVALTPLWVRRKWLKLNSSNERSRDRHVLLFTVAGLMAIGSGIVVLLNKVSPGDSLIPLAFVGAAAAIAFIPDRSDGSTESD